jgi:hypothetical protein
MDVNSYKIRYNPNLSGDTYINIPIDLDFTPINQTDLRQSKLIDTEIKKIINPIIDYERFRYKCGYLDSGQIKKVESLTYQLNFINGGRWSDIGFNKSDLQYNKNGLLLSYLEIKFYDSKDKNTRKLKDKVKIYPNKYDLINSGNFPFNDVSFTISSNIIDKQSDNDGYFLYHKIKIPETGESLFGEFNFFNAKTGKLYRFTTTDGYTTPTSSIKLNQLNDNMYVEYLFKRYNTEFYYTIHDCIVVPQNSTQIARVNDPHRSLIMYTTLPLHRRHREGVGINPTMPVGHKIIPPAPRQITGNKQLLIQMFELKVV